MKVSLTSYLPTEKPHKNQQFTPIELLYGRHVQGPFEALRASWTGEEVEELEGLSQMRERLEEMTKIVEENRKRGLIKKTEVLL